MGGPYRGTLLEFGESVLAHFQRWEKDLGILAPKLADRWKSAVWLGKSDLKDEHLVRIDGVEHARSVRRLVEHSWSEENLRAVVESPKKPKMTVDISLAAEPLAPLHDAARRTRGIRRNAGGAIGHNRDFRSVELRQRREAHRNTREYVCEERSDDEITEGRPHLFPLLMIL